MWPELYKTHISSKINSHNFSQMAVVQYCKIPYQAQTLPARFSSRTRRHQCAASSSLESSALVDAHRGNDHIKRCSSP